MQSYTVHLAEAGRIEDASFVPDRWAWLGFVFGPAWLAYHRLWISAVLAAVATVGVGALGISQGMNPGAASLLSTLVNLAIGFEGNSLRRWRLERKGQRVIAVVSARTEEEAETRFFSLYPDRRAAALRAGAGGAVSQGSLPVATAGIIGLFPQPGGRM